MTYSMPQSRASFPPFPNFEMFGLVPRNGGRVATISAKDDTGTVVASGAIWMTPKSRVGGFDLSFRDDAALSEYECYALDILVERCCSGLWKLRDLRIRTRRDTYAWALVRDAIAAGCAA